MDRKQLEQAAWDATPKDARRAKITRSMMKGDTTERLSGNAREILVFDPSGSTPGSMNQFRPLWSLFSDELQQAKAGKTPRIRAPYNRMRADYTGDVESSPVRARSHMTKSKASSKSTRCYMAKNEPPAWSKGLDMTESRKLASRISMSPEEHEKLARSKSSAAARQPYTVSIETVGTKPSSTLRRGLFVYVTPPGVGYSNPGKCARILRAAGLTVSDTAPHHVYVVAGDLTVDEVKDRVLAALLAAGVHVSKVA